MRRAVFTALLAVFAAGGCGDDVPKPKPLTDAEAEKFKQEQKVVEDEERGPVQKKGKAKKG